MNLNNMQPMDKKELELITQKLNKLFLKDKKIQDYFLSKTVLNSALLNGIGKENTLDFVVTNNSIKETCSSIEVVPTIIQKTEDGNFSPITASVAFDLQFFTNPKFLQHNILLNLFFNWFNKIKKIPSEERDEEEIKVKIKNFENLFLKSLSKQDLLKILNEIHNLSKKNKIPNLLCIKSDKSEKFLLTKNNWFNELLNNFLISSNLINSFDGNKKWEDEDFNLDITFNLSKDLLEKINSKEKTSSSFFTFGIKITPKNKNAFDKFATYKKDNVNVNCFYNPKSL
ncbi:MAG: hypothetical protein ACRC4M_04045 [Mycoplasma sp.]